MDTPDTVEKVTKRRGRPKKNVDPATPMGELIAREAATTKARKETNKVVEKYFELRGGKLSLCKVTAAGSIYRVFVGSVNDKKDGQQVQDYVKRLQAEGRLRHRV